MVKTRVVYDQDYNQLLFEGKGVVDIDQPTAVKIETELQEEVSWIDDAMVDNDYPGITVVNIATTKEFRELPEKDRSSRFISVIDRILKRLGTHRGKVALSFSSDKLSRLK